MDNETITFTLTKKEAETIQWWLHCHFTDCLTDDDEFDKEWFAKSLNMLDKIEIPLKHADIISTTTREYYCEKK